MKEITTHDQESIRAIVKKVVNGENFDMTPAVARQVAIINFIKDLKDQDYTRREIMKELCNDFKRFGIASKTSAYIYYHEFINIYDQRNLFEQKELMMSILQENILEDKERELTKGEPDGKVLAAHNKSMIDLLKLMPKTPPIDYSKVQLPDIFFSFDPASLNTPVELNEEKLQKKLKKYWDVEKKQYSELIKSMATDAIIVEE